LDVQCYSGQNLKKLEAGELRNTPLVKLQRIPNECTQMLYIASIMSRRLHSPSDDILEVGRLAIRLHMQIFFTALPTKHTQDNGYNQRMQFHLITKQAINNTIQGTLTSAKNSYLSNFTRQMQMYNDSSLCDHDCLRE
jgi:hypothetical protein